MYTREVSTHIDASPEAVYDYVTDLARHPEWAAAKLELTVGPAGENGLPTFSSVVHTMGSPKAKGRVLKMERPGLFEYESADPSGLYRWTVNIEPDGAGTNFSQRLTQMEVPLWFRAIQPLVFSVVGKGTMEKGVANIKERVEAAKRAPA